MPNLANDEPAWRQADEHFGGDRLPPKQLDGQPHSVRQQMPRRLAVLRQNLPPQAKVVPIEFNRQQAAAERQQCFTVLVIEDFRAAVDFTLLDRELQAPLAARSTQIRNGQSSLGRPMLNP